MEVPAQPPSDPNTDEFDQDEWLFSSVKSYRKLHMYDLIQPTKTIAWIHDQVLGICVASFHKDSKNEIHHLSLPDSLTKRGSNDESRSCKRDFVVTGGGFHDKPIEHLQHISDNCVMSSETDENSVRVWKLSDSDTDVIHEKTCIRNPKRRRKTAKFSSHRSELSKVVLGSSPSDVCLIDARTERVLSMSDSTNEETLAAIEMLDDHTVAICSKSSGTLWMMDTREKLTFLDGHSSGVGSSASWTSCCSDSEVNGGPFNIARLNSEGEIFFHDRRNLDQPYCQISTSLCGQRTSSLHIQMAPVSSDKVSVSGFDSSVYVYDTSVINAENKGRVEPVFTHKGHLACAETNRHDLSILTHTWHPWQPEVILSSASDGSLHAWEYSSIT